ncbi:MAG: DUF4145 domain-containing protein [Verrucomicrobia bacterium]|nr:MAG: DUF4145 domain-containing protein [Verrucomicrobiota bacterium]TAE87854.1 MAG: DUF4145 domain-containing protein [Verrucomicrobiota bacterium]TAF25597.1 MAG: DUF4145 domain-containing protein [Verrucomicrobiota bacterium]TAF41336.1 MAG: DUF4145 domain-containing protein [Verrucomicrobiota bacterium]
MPPDASNFSFLSPEFAELAEPCRRAERLAMPDPRAACFYARFALEAAVRWLYQHDRSLRMPYDQALGALIHEPSFQAAVPEAVFQKTRVIQRSGNQAVHQQRPVTQFEALQTLKELHHVLYWLARTYTRQGAARFAAVVYDPALVPTAAAAPPLDRKRLAELEAELEASARAAAEKDKRLGELDAELEQLRAELAAAKAANQQQPDPHDYSEAETRTHLIDLELKRAGWPLDQPRDREFELRGMPNAKGIGYADYVLWGDDGLPLAVVEAKKTTADARAGQQQAKLYADCLEAMTGRRPLIFYTNGYDTWLWDDAFYPPRRVQGFYKKDELERLIQRRTSRKALAVSAINAAIIDRYYQKRAIGCIGETFMSGRRKSLLVQATGTGKTRTAIALVDLLQRANWAKRVLFLADRVSLVNQAVNAFKKHLPESSPVNLVTEKDKEGRVYACTYPTMIGLIDDAKNGTARFSVGHFDLIVIDEAHRSIYQKYRAIFSYFDCLLVGLTATPREEIDRNTYELFDLEPGVPTDAYELSRAVEDGFLVPPRAEQIDMRFPREGIRYDQLSDEEKAHWESLDWGDEGEEGLPDAVNASAVNKWLFNADTVDKVLQTLMERGHKVAEGDRLGKTILFARNHDHAVFIEERFNFHYPHLKGHFARIIDNKAKYPQSLIDDFSIPDKNPHIAISVDMLDTGIDVPEVVNLVFFKPVYSRTKFWQMIGRGTRLCPDLYGPGLDKQDFRVFDFCFNFDFFRENPEGIEGSVAQPLGVRLFHSRVRLIGHLQGQPELAPKGELLGSVKETLRTEIAGMNRDNFLVRMHLRTVERFQQDGTWEGAIDKSSLHQLANEVAGLPSAAPMDDIEPRLFDLTLLRMQLAHVEGMGGHFETLRNQVTGIASQLEEKTAIPAVKAQLAYLQAIQEPSFWEGIDLDLLEEVRLRLRDLTRFIDKSKRRNVYSNFKDEIQGIREGEPIPIPTMTGAQYEKKVRDYLRNHLDHFVIGKLRQNQPLTPTDLEQLETLLVEIGETHGPVLLDGLLRRTESPSLAHFVRRTVGLDRSAVLALFSDFLEIRDLNPAQIRFIGTLVDQLAARGIVDASALYEPPFSDVHAGGPDELFAGKDSVIEGIFDRLRALEPDQAAV